MAMKDRSCSTKGTFALSLLDLGANFSSPHLTSSPDGRVRSRGTWTWSCPGAGERGSASGWTYLLPWPVELDKYHQPLLGTLVQAQSQARGSSAPCTANRGPGLWSFVSRHRQSKSLPASLMYCSNYSSRCS
jgi:hypothetical protein